MIIKIENRRDHRFALMVIGFLMDIDIDDRVTGFLDLLAEEVEKYEEQEWPFEEKKTVDKQKLVRYNAI